MGKLSLLTALKAGRRVGNLSTWRPMTLATDIPIADERIVRGDPKWCPAGCNEPGAGCAARKRAGTVFQWRHLELDVLKSRPLVMLAGGPVYPSYFRGDLRIGMFRPLLQPVILTMGFNSDISKWDVSSVTDLGHMFEDAIKFNADISAWDVSKAANMGYLFAGCKRFNIDISAWKISPTLQNITHFLDGAVSHSQALNVSGWDTSNTIRFRISIKALDRRNDR